jgi:hypothetical protein
MLSGVPRAGPSKHRSLLGRIWAIDVAELTEEFLQYRECARVVWNLFLRVCPDGESSFFDLEIELFKAMVVDYYAKYHEREKLGEYDYEKFLRIVPATENKAVPVLVSQKHPEGGILWIPAEWGGASDVRYRKLFDFAPFDGLYRDFRYVEGIVIESRDPTFSRGQRILVEPDEVRFYDES